MQAKLVRFQVKICKIHAKLVKFQAKLVKFQAKLVKFQAKLVKFQAKSKARGLGSTKNFVKLAKRLQSDFHSIEKQL